MNNFRYRKIAIIDPLVSAKYLAASFKNKVYTVAVYSMDNTVLDEYSAIDNSLFDEQIVVTGMDILSIADMLKRRGIEYILNGAEESTILADELSQLITPEFANSSETSLYRFDKLAMQDALAMHNLPTIQQFAIDLNDINSQVLNSITYPVFCKPCRGYGSKNSFKITSKQDACDKFLQIQQHESEHRYLIQEFLEGVEYIVDTFSVNGVHYVSSVRCYNKVDYNGTPLYRYADVVCDVVMWNQCAVYVKKVLDALDLRNGFAHTEIMVQPNGVMKLVELNNRVGGDKGYTQKLAKLAGLSPQDELFINWFTLGVLLESQPNQIQNYVRNMYLFNFAGTPLKNPDNVLKQYPSVQEFLMLHSPGSINATERLDLTCAACFVLMKNSRLDILESDCQHIFAAEKAGLLV